MKNKDELIKRIRIGQLDARDFLIVQFQTTGGDPSQLFEVLEDIVKNQRWNEIIGYNGKPVGSFRRLLEAPQPTGCGIDATKVQKLLEIEHRYERSNESWHKRMVNLRAEVNRLLDQDIEPLRDNHSGINQHTKVSDISDTELSQTGGTSKAYRLARLKRDAPDIAERVIEKEITAAAGIRELRKRQGLPEEKRGAVDFLNAWSARNTLVKQMPEDVLIELIDLLNEWRKGE